MGAFVGALIGAGLTAWIQGYFGEAQPNHSR